MKKSMSILLLVPVFSCCSQILFDWNVSNSTCSMDVSIIYSCFATYSQTALLFLYNRWRCEDFCLPTHDPCQSEELHQTVTFEGRLTNELQRHGRQSFGLRWISIIEKVNAVLMKPTSRNFFGVFNEPYSTPSYDY